MVDHSDKNEEELNNGTMAYERLKRGSKPFK